MGEKNETKIRNWLKKNLDFLEPHLSLIDDEFSLRNPYGSAGYVDILAEDPIGHFVVIEIKQSKNAERSGINEILKYTRLLKEHYGIREDKIRIILISTDWRELLTPYNELVLQTELSIEAYKITWNGSEIVQKEKIKLLPPTSDLKFSSVHKSLHFATETKFNEGFNLIKSELIKFGITEYVLIKLHYDGEKDIPFPFACYVVLVQQSLDYYITLLTLAFSEEYASTNLEAAQENYSNDENQIGYLESVILNKVNCNAMDVYGGDQDLLDSYIYQNWKVTDLVKSGRITKDPRNNRDQLLRELRGLEDRNSLRYLNFTKSEYRSRTKSMNQNIKLFLEGNPIWLDHITSLIERYSSGSEFFSTLLYVYNPPSMLTQLYMMLSTDNWEQYSPMYMLIFEFEDRSLSYFGGIESKKDIRPSYSHLLHCLENDMFLLMEEKGTGCNNERIMEALGLEYISTQIDEYRNIYEVTIEDGSLRETKRNSLLNLPTFFEKNPKVAKQILQTFKNVARL